MSSVEAGPPTGETDADRTARARIRDTAIRCFAESGVAATSVRAIAKAARVSPALVIHHFGSKDALRVACDQHVAALVREQKVTAMAEGPSLDPLAAFRVYREGPPLLPYLARTLVDGSPHVAELIDEMVADAVGYLQTGVDAGMLTPSDHPYGRAAVLTLWSLGALVLHEHTRRLLDVDLLGDPQAATDYFLPALELFGEGLLTRQAYDAIQASMSHPAREDGS
ncbi:TetR family transcriptional regulator [Egicoccus halophilus]|nr:TetR family transcriptional regulator [Egicoccus halophilus]